jgi:uncharacterized protein YodC (DUF2158 family)
MSETVLKVGDIVKRKSGGPRMTVRVIDTDTASGEVTVFCDWFSGTTHQQGNFPPDALRDASMDLT